MQPELAKSRSTIGFVEFRVLGPLEVVDQGGDPVPLGGRRQRLVLAFLILEANRVVAVDTLIDRIWGDEPPDAARGTLSAYVSRLRRLLGSDRIQPRSPGYVLLAERSEVDLLRFTDLIEAARRQRTDRQAAADILAQALDLWRGEPLADLADQDAMQPVITQLGELRLGALEDRMEVEIALGRHRESVPDLERLTAEHPLRERLWGQLMAALYRAGRQGDALAAFHRARTTLLEELGIDPSADLRQLYDQILNQDPALEIGPVVAALAEPMPPPTMAPRPERMAPRRRLAPLAIGTAVILGAALIGWRLSAMAESVEPTSWAIGLDMPLSGSGATLGQPVVNAVQMAVDELNASGSIPGITLTLSPLDDAMDPDRAAENVAALAADPGVIAMIGPWGSAPTFATIPITNEAGLLECSPAATHPGLTKPRDGALDLRSAHPDAINFIRLPPADDIQALAMAAFAYHSLLSRTALVIDDSANGRALADAFETAFQQLGGATERRALNPGADPRSILAPLADELNPPELVFVGAELPTVASVRQAMADAGRLSTPLLSWDALVFPAPGEPSYFERLGASAAGSFAAHASLPDHKFSFADAYRQRFGSEPDEYAAAGYACVEVIAAALRGVPSTTRPDELRDQLRAFAVDPGHRYETVLGTIGFDANGDALQQFVTFYRVDPAGADGAGEWVIFKKQDFGPAP